MFTRVLSSDEIRLFCSVVVGVEVAGVLITSIWILLYWKVSASTSQRKTLIYNGLIETTYKRYRFNNMQECNVVYETVERAGKKCQTGWSSTECDVPICNTPCIDGKVCIAPDKCECVTTGGGCQSDINECDSVTNNCTLNENMTCQNTLGSYKCHSDDGWKSEVTDGSVIGISVGAVVVGIAIIIAVLLLVKYAMKRMKNQQVKKDLQNETAKTDSNYEDLTTATRTNQVYETIRKPTESNGDAEAGSRGTAARPSTSANVKKGIGGIFKSPRNKDLKIGKATRDSIYPELGPSTEAQMENVYETIKKVPEISIDISAQGKISKYSSHT